MRFTPKAIKASFLVENPGWYQYKIAKHTQKPSEKGDSINHFVVFEGESGEMTDVPVNILFNEKADWQIIPLFTACNGGEKPEVDKDYNFDDLVDIHVRAYTKRGTRQDGTPQNLLTEFQPVA